MLLSEWELKNFIDSSINPAVIAVFPSREIYFSAELLQSMRLDNSTCPKTLDQWYELCSPEDHMKISKLENFIYGHENEISITRKLYCGDGVYRNFRLDAFIVRNNDLRPSKLIGFETSSVSAWLASANEGDKIEFEGKTFEAVRLNGVLTLRDLDLISDLENENLRLRHEIFWHYRTSVSAPVHSETDFMLLEILEKNVTSALNVLTGNIQLKALFRSIYDDNINIGVVGLSDSGKTLFVNALLGERLIPDSINAPVFCTEGETRAARVLYQDGRNEVISGSRLTASALSELKDVSRLELTVPGALIPEGICVTDTPSYKISVNSVKNLISEFDVVFYVTPSGSRFVSIDREYLNLITAVNENIIFLLSKTDLGYDDTEAGKIIHTAAEKISKDIAAIKSEYECEVVPISSEKALDKFYDRNSDAWLSSNFSAVLDYMKALSERAYDRALKLRLRRSLKILEGVEQRSWKILEAEENLKRSSEYKFDMPELKAVDISNIYKTEKAGSSLLMSLIISMREREFRKKFFSLKAFNKTKKAVLIGSDEFQNIRLYSRLMHDVGLEDKLTVNKDFMIEGVEGSEGEEIIIFGGDRNVEADWGEIFKSYIPVISVKAGRIEIMKEELMNAPYTEELKNVKLVIAVEGVIKEKELNECIQELSYIEFFCWKDYEVTGDTR